IHMGQSPSFLGTRFDTNFIGDRIAAQKSLVPLAQNALRIFLSLDREGDPTPTYDLPYHRLLDDATGILFILGLTLALARWREKKFLYSLAGLGLLSLPALLSVGPEQSPRFFAIAPFAAFLSMESFSFLFSRSGVTIRGWAGSLFLAALPIFMLYQNFRVYFVERAANPLCWHWADTEAGIVGRTIAENNEDYEYYLSPAYYRNFSA